MPTKSANNSHNPKDPILRLPMPFSEALERFANVDARDAAQMEAQAEAAEEGLAAAPFVKWVGGKRAIIEELISRLPETFNNYYEPFVGGGALFFSLNGKIKKAFLSDSNFDLVMAYNAIKKDPDALIERLAKHAEKHNEEYYYKVRSKHGLSDPIDIAARFIYLNKTCFNGLFRVNKKGEFNVPIGRYVNPTIVQRENILLCSKVLQKAKIEIHEFDEITPQSGDFCYFDPPYHPTTDTSFTGYTKLDFSEKDQVRLRDFALKLHKSGVKVMLSNSDSKFIRDIYNTKAFHIATVQAPRNVKCKPGARGAVNEVLITNYQV
jgi:DNA adenine methylase